MMMRVGRILFSEWFRESGCSCGQKMSHEPSRYYIPTMGSKTGRVLRFGLSLKSTQPRDRSATLSDLQLHIPHSIRLRHAWYGYAHHQIEDPLWRGPFRHSAWQ